MAKHKTKKREPVVRLFAQRLRESRMSRGMTQANLADATGASITYASELENAATSPGIDLLACLAQILGMMVGDLLPSEEPMDSLSVLRIVCVIS